MKIPKDRRKLAVYSPFSAPAIIWFVLGFLIASILFSTSTEAFTTTTSSLELSSQQPPVEFRSNHELFLIAPTFETSLDLSHQPLLDVIGVDPGQALFWSTIVHWILWDKSPTYVALTFDIICIGITLWDGTVRASVWKRQHEISQILETIIVLLELFLTFTTSSRIQLQYRTSVHRSTGVVILPGYMRSENETWWKKRG